MNSSSSSPRGVALALIWVGIVVGTAGSVGRIVTGDHYLVGVAAVGFAVQFAGWVRHGRRNGSRS